MSSPWGTVAEIAAKNVRRPRQIMISGHLAAAGFLVLAITQHPSDSWLNWYHLANVLFAEAGAFAASSLYQKIDENTRVTVSAAADAIQAARAAPSLDASPTSGPVAREIQARETGDTPIGGPPRA